MTETRRLRAAEKALDLKARLRANRFEAHGDCCEESGLGAVPCTSKICSIEYEAEELLGELAALLSEPQAAQEPELCVFCGRPKSAHRAVTVGTLEQRVRCPVAVSPVLPAPPEGEKP